MGQKMLDPDSVAEYEAWKMHKITGQLDLSVSAFNAEMEGLALAWEDGWRVGREGKKPITENPQRQPGMRGERVTPIPSRRPTSPENLEE